MEIKEFDPFQRSKKALYLHNLERIVFKTPLRILYINVIFLHNLVELTQQRTKGLTTEICMMKSVQTCNPIVQWCMMEITEFDPFKRSKKELYLHNLERIFFKNPLRILYVNVIFLYQVV